MIPTYIIAFNRVTYLKQLLEYLEKLPDTLPIIIDNNSQYPPMVEFLDHTKHQVVRLTENIGFRGAYERKIIKLGTDHERQYGQKYYILTDGDLDLSSCPLDLIDVLKDGLARYRWAKKAGVGLELSDIPKGSLFRDDVIKWEKQFWKNRLDHRFFNSSIDSTFFLGWSHIPFDWDTRVLHAIRSSVPYVARHLPWYETEESLTEEDLFYYRNLSPTVFTFWSTRIRELILSTNR